MDPTVGGIIGGALVALIAGVFGIRQARILEAERSKAAANTLSMESARVQIDGFDRLTERQEAEINRLNLALVEERKIAEAFAAARDRLERENRTLRDRIHREDRPDE